LRCGGIDIKTPLLSVFCIWTKPFRHDRAREAFCGEKVVGVELKLVVLDGTAGWFPLSYQVGPKRSFCYVQLRLWFVSVADLGPWVVAFRTLVTSDGLRLMTNNAQVINNADDIVMATWWLRCWHMVAPILSSTKCMRHLNFRYWSYNPVISPLKAERACPVFLGVPGGVTFLLMLNFRACL